MPLLPDAEPLNLAGSSPAVLLLHGFSGQPTSMKPWARYLSDHAGAAVSVPRLPGHGTTWQEMNRTTWLDWYAEAERAFLQLRGEHDEVYVFGLSMGGTLSLRLAQKHGQAIAGLVVVNPSVFTTRLDRFALPLLRYLVPAFPGITNDIKKPGGDEGAYDKLPLRAAHELTKLWSDTKQNMAAVTAPLLVYTSVEDHVVEPENSEWILEHVSSDDRRQEFLTDSFHVATLDNDAEAIFAGSLAFVRSRAAVR